MKTSVIIPALNEAKGILGSLASVKNQQGESEIIVVDGGSHDETAEIARLHANVITCKRGRAVQMNAGACYARGDVLLFLHADTCLSPGGLSAMETALMDPQVVGGTFRLRFDSPGYLLRVITFFTHFRFRYFHYGDQGIFVRRAVFEQLGGFREIPIMEDLEFFKRLHGAGKVALLPHPVTTSARRYLEHGIVQQQLLDILLVILYLGGVRPETLLRWYEATDSRPG
jgi:rSAM/selenodomain-associated transferase 2